MRVLLVSDTYSPVVGGIEAQVATLGTALSAAGHEVVVATATRGPALANSAASGADRFEVVRLPMPRVLGHRLRSIRMNPWAGESLARLAAQCDVVHAHVGLVSPFAELALRRALIQHRPAVLTVHSLWGKSAHVQRWLGRLTRWVHSGVVPSAVSSAAAQRVTVALPAGSQAAVLPNILPPGRWSPVHPPARVGPLRVVSASRFTHRKRDVALVRAVARAAAGSQRGVRLTIAGSGPRIGAVQRTATRLGLWLDLPGVLSPAELEQRYARAELFASAVRAEAFGIAALEARAVGRPVLGLAGTGLGDVIAGRGGGGGPAGVLVADDKALATELARLADDPGRLDHLTVAARGAHGFTAREIVPLALALYRLAGAHS